MLHRRPKHWSEKPALFWELAWSRSGGEASRLPLGLIHTHLIHNCTTTLQYLLLSCIFVLSISLRFTLIPLHYQTIITLTYTLLLLITPLCHFAWDFITWCICSSATTVVGTVCVPLLTSFYCSFDLNCLIFYFYHIHTQSFSIIYFLFIYYPFLFFII